MDIYLDQPDLRIYSNQNILDSNLAANSDITELLQLLIPEIYLDDSVAGFQTIGETQINTLIRRSILRPLEKNLAKQIGLNDLKINYNLGEKIIAGTDSTLGLQFMKHILSDRLILNLSTQMDLSEDNNSNQANSMELSEIKLNIDIKGMTPFFVVIVALLLISKIPTFSLKKIKISSQLSIFLLFGIVIIFISLIFFTFESLLIIGGIYFISIPLSFYSYRKTAKTINNQSEEDHEDIL